MSEVSGENNNIQNNKPVAKDGSGTKELRSAEYHRMSVEKRRIGNAEVTFLGMDHFPETPPRPPYPREEVSKLISDSDAVIVEYSPRELERTVFNDPEPIGSQAREFARALGMTDFFGFIEKLAEEYKKDIIVVDPANKFAFAATEAMAMGQAVIGVGFVAAAEKLESLLKNRMSRRAFLRLGGLGIAAGVSQMALYNLPKDQEAVATAKKIFPNVRDLRHVVVASGIDQICRSGKYSRPLVIYPPSHLRDGILPYLDNPAVRGAKFLMYKEMKLPGVDFQIRSFPFTNGGYPDQSINEPIKK